MDERTMRAVGAAHGLARALREFDPEPADEFVALPLATPDDVFRWGLTLSEAGVERLTRLLQAASPVPAPAGRRPRHLHVVREAS
ncbi:hypothetical protein ACIF8T_21680 [Streptomyces sp. NPDC085946]|uniref:hypothetical protein n=1 Tax=Streptomyces sp. NPDC085946 TaxID=3365744 RepID=UPI0037D67AB3